MNIKHLVTVIVISSFLVISPLAQAEEMTAPPAPETPAAPVTGYQGMLPYIQENAALHKEARKKYGAKKSRKKNKKTKSKKKSGKGTSKKSKSSKKK